MATWQPKEIRKERDQAGRCRVLVSYSDGTHHDRQVISVSPGTTDAAIEDAIAAQLKFLEARDEAFDALTAKVTSAEEIIGAISVRPEPIKPPAVEPTPEQLFHEALNKLRAAQEMVTLGLAREDDVELKARRDAAAALFSWRLVD